MAIGLTSFTQATVCGTIISRFKWKEEVARSQQILENMSASMAPHEESPAPAAASAAAAAASGAGHGSNGNGQGGKEKAQ